LPRVRLLKPFKKKAHVEAAIKDALHNRNYCSKGEQSKAEWDMHGIKGKNYGKNAKVEVFGKMPTQGSRTDIEEYRDQLLAGEITVAQLRQTMNPYAYNNIYKTLIQYESDYLLTRKRTSMTAGVFFFGRSGVGKSAEIFLTNDTYTHPRCGAYFDKYAGQTNFLIDEIRAHEDEHKLSFRDILDYCGRNTVMLNRKGKDAVEFTSKCVYITSPWPPQTIWPNEKGEDWEQFFRRYTVIRVNSDGTRDVISMPPDEKDKKFPVTYSRHFTDDLTSRERGLAVIQLNQFHIVLASSKIKYSTLCLTKPPRGALDFLLFSVF